MRGERRKFFTAVSILVGTCIGAGVLGIPYVASQAGFFIAFAYILVLGAIILMVNLYFGEVILRTRGHHQIAGYAQKYLGKKGFYVLEFATIFGVYSAIVAYMLGVGDSLSFLFFGSLKYGTFFGVGFGLAMSALLWRGISALKRFEKIGVSIILVLLAVIVLIFIKDVSISNLYYLDLAHVFLPFGVVLFALMSFHAIPEIEIILHRKENYFRKVLLLGTLISVSFYVLFTLVVVGMKGAETPEIATLALGSFFVILGIFTMFTSYLSLGNALQSNFIYDERFSKWKAWFLAAIVPIIIFLLVKGFGFFSFTRILGIAGIVSGGLIAVLVLLMVKRAKKKGNRNPEYEMPASWIVIGALVLVFIVAMVVELWKVL